ncbi:MAG: DUF3450 domain-containing protein [Thermodesulfobacteriota bacterium]
MIRRIMLSTALLVFVTQATVFAATPKKVQKKMESAIKTESKAQAKADNWNMSKDDLVNEIRELQTRLTWLEYQKGKHEIYVQGLKDNIADLEAKKLEARILRENLEPYLDEVVARTEDFITKDMPFLDAERQQRLNFLHNTLNDYHLDLGEKLRRVLEALSVEATYGKMVTASEETFNIDGEDTQVTLFRLGRMAMYYQTIDGAKLGRWNAAVRKWEPMSKDFARDLRHAIEMARRERSVQLIQLPVGAVQ